MNRNLEIERKFLVADPSILDTVDGQIYRQGYLSTTVERTVRVRRAGDAGWLTVKGKSVGCTRSEFEYAIPVEDADQMMDELCIGTVITKTRHRLEADGHVWEIDRFASPHEGLILAEVELQAEDEEVPLPAWLGPEVTGDHRFSNSYLSTHPDETPTIGLETA